MSTWICSRSLLPNQSTGSFWRLDPMSGWRYGIELICNIPGLQKSFRYCSTSTFRLIYKLQLLYRIWRQMVAVFLGKPVNQSGGQLTFLSIWLEVMSGVSQGSVLGPLLFLVFVNDLPDWICMFADDTKIWTRITSRPYRIKDFADLQKDLDSLSIWSANWQLRFNPDKWKVMHVGHQHKPNYTDWNIQEVTEERDLGVLTIPVHWIWRKTTKA